MDKAEQDGLTVSAERLIPRVARLFKPYRGQVGLVALAILVSSAVGVANPLLIKVVFDQALFPPAGHPNTSLLYVLVALMLGLAILGGAIGIGQTYLTSVVGQKVMQDLRNQLYAHLQRMSLRFFTATRTGEIQSRLQNDVGGVQTVVTTTVSSILSNIVVVLSTLVAMLILSWQLTLLSLCVVPIFIYMTYRVGKARRQITSSTQKTMANLSALTEETLSVSGILLSKVFAREQTGIDQYREENRRLAELQVRQQMTGRGFFAIVQTFFSVSPALVYLVSGFVIANGGGAGITAGTIVAFTALQTRLLFPVGSLLQVSTEIQSSLALFERIFQYLDLEHDIVDSPDAETVSRDRVRGAVRFDRVYFRYEEPVLPPGLAPDEVAGNGDEGLPLPTRLWTLEDVSLEIEPGQLAAIVGPSGAGKTTISYLVPRLYDVTEGSVSIDGRDVREIALASLAEMIGMVTQETYLFHATVRENLLYARPGATDAQLESAARAAFIHERIVDLSDGYDTLVGERGYRMSGGEKQRLAIARVLLKDPSILILDEATSALDTASERIVQGALQPLMAERTTIAIAHRLSTILAADVIFVLDRGRIVERGRHEELLELGGLYASLYQEQFGAGLVEARCEDGLVLSSGEVLSTTS
ncbi:MAG TPA: ABC transporter ATP-binding protein [Gaiellaceae bacterium]|jgi:ATP-binding cassette subfamily B protein|nr:ABC transporter ATP-binding protein [Gaiellaceae bacterium]